MCIRDSSDAIPIVPRGYRWVHRPALRPAQGNKVPAHCRTKSAWGVAMCADGKKAKAQYQKDGKTLKFDVQCGCNGGYKLVAHQFSSVDSECTGSAQESRSNLTSSVATALEHHVEKAAAWVAACSAIKDSPNKFASRPLQLEPIKAGAKKLSVFSAPWRMRKLCLLYTSPSPRDRTRSRMPSSA
eukprot:TRINITY_DN26974_c0_g1_i1.p1 TRINITY_DN26974_c0_g1~~TRINITY_DN26974_c0_g1_i1.p1  ORF type:complete len:185 (-),score=53.04 TRINITY_DN26974_c0_g1_i1:78-632(-)